MVVATGWSLPHFSIIKLKYKMATRTPSLTGFCSFVSLATLGLLCLTRNAYTVCSLMLLYGSPTSLHLCHACRYFKFHMYNITAVVLIKFALLGNDIIIRLFNTMLFDTIVVCVPEQESNSSW